MSSGLQNVGSSMLECCTPKRISIGMVAFQTKTTSEHSYTSHRNALEHKTNDFLFNQTLHCMHWSVCI